MSDIYDGRGGVISEEKNLRIPLPRESRHGSVVPGTMNRSSCLGQLMPVGRSHEQYFMTELKEKQHSRYRVSVPGVLLNNQYSMRIARIPSGSYRLWSHRIYAMAKSNNTPSTHTEILALRGHGRLTGPYAIS